MGQWTHASSSRFNRHTHTGSDSTVLFCMLSALSLFPRYGNLPQPTNICETGSDLPQMGGEDVLPAFRAEVCDKVCTTHCGYGRAMSAARAPAYSASASGSSCT